jgi:hypothetical protein
MGHAISDDVPPRASVRWHVMFDGCENVTREIPSRSADSTSAAAAAESRRTSVSSRFALGGGPLR